jgi:hypothetical protein
LYNEKISAILYQPLTVILTSVSTLPGGWIYAAEFIR